MIFLCLFAQFVEQQQYLKLLVKIGLRHIVAFFRERTPGYPVLSGICMLSLRYPRNFKGVADFIDGRQYIILLHFFVHNSFDNRVGQLVIFRRGRKIINKKVFKIGCCFMAYQVLIRGISYRGADMAVFTTMIVI